MIIIDDYLKCKYLKIFKLYSLIIGLRVENVVDFILYMN